VGEARSKLQWDAQHVDKVAADNHPGSMDAAFAGIRPQTGIFDVVADVVRRTRGVRDV
jgi:hypothetical protein